MDLGRLMASTLDILAGKLKVTLVVTTVALGLLSAPAISSAETITFHKWLRAGGTADQTFDFAIDGTQCTSGVSDRGYQSCSTTAGAHTISEIDPGANFALTYIDCDNAAFRDNTFDPISRSAEIWIVPSEHFICTFTNTDQRATLTLKKELAPGGTADQTFGLGATGAFTSCGPLNVNVGTPQDCPPLLADTYTVYEQTPDPNFKLTDISCDNAGFRNNTFDPISRTARVTIVPSEHVTCTFTNVWQPLPPSAFKNAAKFCDALHASMGSSAFAERYRTFGQCVRQNHTAQVPSILSISN